MYSRTSIVYYSILSKKGNQYLFSADKIWHVYSNPNNLSICPVLSLAKYVLSLNEILKAITISTPDEYQHELFVEVFHRVICKNIDTLQVIGVKENPHG